MNERIGLRKHELIESNNLWIFAKPDFDNISKKKIKLFLQWKENHTFWLKLQKMLKRKKQSRHSKKRRRK